MIFLQNDTAKRNECPYYHFARCHHICRTHRIQWQLCLYGTSVSRLPNSRIVLCSIRLTNSNTSFSLQSHALAFFRSFLGIQQSCFRESDSTFVVFIDDDSSFSGTMNFVDTDVGSTYCAPPGNRLFAEDPGSSCFLGGTCEGQCEVLATEEKCLANLVDTGVPTGAPAAPSPPTQSPTVAPSTQEPSAAPTLPPISPAPTAFTRSPVVAPTSSPTIRGSSAPTPELEPEETVLPTVAPTECPNPKLIKQPKYKPKTKLSKYGRSGSRKKKQKDFKPVEKFYYGGGGSYAYKDSVAASTSKDQHEEEEDSLGYYYFWICPDSDSKSGKGKKSKDMGKGKMQSPKKSGMKKQMKSLKGSSKNTKSKGGGKGKGKRVLGENSTGEPRPGLRRHRL